MAQPTEVEAPPSSAQTPAKPENHAAPPPPPPRRENFFRSRPYARVLLIIVAIVLLVGGFIAYRYFSSYESTDDAQIDGHLMPISARIPGYIIKVNVDDNQYVHQGDILAEMDPRDYQVAVEKAQADLADAEATARSLEHQCAHYFRQHHQPGFRVAGRHRRCPGGNRRRAATSSTPLKPSLTQAEANNVKAQADLVRYKQLVDKQEISRQLYDTAVAQAGVSSAAVSAAKSSASAAEQQITRPVPSSCRRRLICAPRKLARSKWLKRALAHNPPWPLCSRSKPLSIRPSSTCRTPRSSSHRRHRHQERRSGHERSGRPAVIQRGSSR